MTQGYRSWFKGLINVWTMPATVLKNKVMYRQFIHSVALVNEKYCTCLRPLYEGWNFNSGNYLFTTDTK